MPGCRKYELRLEKALEARGKRLEFIIMDLSPVTDIDASAVHFLQDWITQHQTRGVQPVFANPSRLVVRLLERSGEACLLQPPSGLPVCNAELCC